MLRGPFGRKCGTTGTSGTMVLSSSLISMCLDYNHGIILPTLDPSSFLITFTLSIIIVISSALQMIFSGLRVMYFKRESDFRRLISKLKEAGYPCTYNEVKKEINLKPNPDIKARIIWEKSKRVRLILKAKKKLDRDVKERVERGFENEINKVIYKKCLEIKLGGLLNIVVTVGAICGIIALIIALSQL